MGTHYTAKETISKVNRESTDWVKIFTCYEFDKRLTCRKYIQPKKLHKNKISNPVKNWTKEMGKHFPEMKHKWPQTLSRKHAGSLVIR